MNNRTEAMQTPEYIEAEGVFASGDVTAKSDSELSSYLIAICRNETGDDSIYARDMMRVDTLNQLLLSCHIEKLDQAASRMQKWFMGIAVLSLVAALIQVGVGWRQFTSAVAVEQK